jgi:recombination protein RecT
MAEQSKALTPFQVASSLVKNVENSVTKYVENKQLDLPQNYSAGNALRQMQLKIQDDSKLMSCTQASLYKAMLDCVVLGLNISKAQAYIIPYGNTAQLSVSYQGKKAIAMRIDPTIEDIIARPIRIGEIFEFEDLDNGYSKIIKHQRTLESMNSADFLGGYATILYNDGKPSKSLIMTYERIKKSWAMSQMKPIDEKGNVKESSTHAKFADEMIAKTLITAICKPIINSSDDSDLFCQTAQTLDINEAQAIANAEKEEHANTGEVVDIDLDIIETDPETGEVI